MRLLCILLFSTLAFSYDCDDKSYEQLKKDHLKVVIVNAELEVWNKNKSKKYHNANDRARRGSRELKKIGATESSSERYKYVTVFNGLKYKHHQYYMKRKDQIREMKSIIEDCLDEYQQ